MFVPAPGMPAGMVFSTPTVEDALEKQLGWLVAAALGPGEFGFGGDQPSLDGSPEDGGTVAFQVALDPLEKRNSLVQAAEVRFDGGNDPTLLRQRCEDG